MGISEHCAGFKAVNIRAAQSRASVQSWWGGNAAQACREHVIQACMQALGMYKDPNPPFLRMDGWEA